MKIHLRHKIISLAIISALIPVLILVFFLQFRRAPISGIVQGEMNNLLIEDLKSKVDDIYTSFYMAGVMLDRQLEMSMAMIDYMLEIKGFPSLSKNETVTWKVMSNLIDGEPTSITLPKFMIGNEGISADEMVYDSIPVISKIDDLTGARVTLYQRTNPGGDLLRIASNMSVTSKDKSTAILIPAHQADGSFNPLNRAVLSDQRYITNGYDEEGDLVISLYKALNDKQGHIIGALAVSLKIQDLSIYFTEAMKNLTIGKNGYFFVLKGSKVGIDNALLIHSVDVSKDKILTPASIAIYETIRKNFASDDISSNTTIGNYTKIFVETHSWLDEGEKRPSEKAIVYAYFAGWDLIIGVTAYTQDFEASYVAVRTAFVRLMWAVVIGGIIIMIIVGAIALIAGGIIANPIGIITNIARKVAQGDLNSATTYINSIESSHQHVAKVRHSQDETGDLFRAIILMIDNLNNLIGQVRKASLQLIGTATNIDVTSKEQENTIKNFGSYTNQIAAAVKQISSTSQELYKTMTGVSQVATETGAMVDAGLNELSDMESTMKNLTEATTSVSGKLSTITEKAKNITSVVTTISKVADQTNLLALNAAIEAEKAGEFGMGFSVIANEIKHLADQTALATFDIEQMVGEMQSSVGAGVMEMDKFTDEVKSGAEEVGMISGRLEKIILQVQQLTPRFEMVKEGMQLQSQGAEQINDAMANLTEAADKTIVVLQEFENATASLHNAVDGLKGEVLKFKVLENVHLTDTVEAKPVKSITSE